ncbi:MAG: hypothetical protein AAFQ40_12935 [Cyanobacteria bacterium J06623_5]
MDWLEIIAQISQIAGIISVIFAALSIRSNTQLSKKQWNIDTFNLYSEKHQSVVDSFPDRAFYNRFDPSKLPPRSSELTAAVRRYLFVISAVHYLAYQEYLADSIWDVWRRDIDRTLTCELIYREWPDIKAEFDSFEAFTAFVEERFQAAQKDLHQSQSANSQNANTGDTSQIKNK